MANRPLDPRDNRFWEEEYNKMFSELSPIVISLFLAGGQNGTQQLPPFAQLLINWDTFSKDAVDWLSRFGRDYLRGINNTSKDQVVKAIDSWIREGKPLPDLVKIYRRY
jgi:hypothetical protein